MERQIDYYFLGLAAYPSSRSYPTQDKHNPKEEAEYLRGWNAGKTLAENQQEFE